jgi:hypothetical protein
MKASFWKALEALGASGAALFTWKFRLGGDWDDCRPFLKATGRTADFVIDPRKPRFHLTVSPQGDAFVGYYEEETEIPPMPFSSEEVAEFAPHWMPIAKALAAAVGFDFGAWEADGAVRRIGSLQDPFGHVRPVLLFLPGGHLGDHAALVRSLIGRTDCTILLPTSRWITGELENLRERNGLAFVDLSERLAQAATCPTPPAPLPVTGPRKSSGVPTVRAVIRAVDGLTWDQVRIEVGASRTVHLKAPGQSGKFVFPPNSQLQPDHPVGMLMTLAADGEWRNPPLGSAEYERVSRAFRRLRKLLMALVPLPGDPFQPHRGSFVPVFEIGVHAGLLPENQRHRRS